MGYLIVPLRRPLCVDAHSRVRIRFEYHPGDEIDALMGNAQATALPPAGGDPPVRAPA